MAPRDSKFTAGALLVVGGAPGTTGAAVLTATAALRADAGYVTLAVPSASLAVAESLALEPVKRGFAFATALDELAPDLERAYALAIGPGLGRSDGAQALVRALLERSALPVVVDADGLFGLEPVEREAPTVLTPHAGELARLLGTRRRLGRRAPARGGRSVRRAIRRGRRAEGRRHDRPRARRADRSCATPARPSLATAGTGDVLTGVLGAFLAKGLDPTDAAVAAAMAHGLAARAAPSQAGLIASDVVSALPSVLA